MTTETRLPVSPDEMGRFVQTKSYRIHYYEHGAGHPVILLHGSGPGATGWSNFRPNIEFLAAANRVIAVDMPGWGKSDTENGELGYNHGASLIDVMDALAIESAALVGNSMGGMTALRVAVEHPDRVSHLVTMGAPAPGISYFAPGDGLSEGLKVLVAAYVDPSAANMKRLVEIMCFDKSMATDELAQLRSAAALAAPAHLKSFLNRPFDPQFNELAAHLPRLTVPSLFIHGRDDRVVPFESSLRLVSMVPDSRFLLLNRCGHWAQIEHAEEFNRTVAAFVSRQPRP
jgi:2-hydroxy-6-oxonona-2,4-dienedioate hydrolase